MTDTFPTECRAAPARYDGLGWVFVLVGLALSTVLGLLSDGIYMNDDATHYFIARAGFGDPVALLSRWGRVGYTLPTAPVAHWFGFDGCRVFSAIQTALIALLAWRTARRLIGPGFFAACAALLVWLQPLTFRLAMTTLTETTGAFYLTLAIFLYVRRNRLLACAAFSALFLTRDETLALGPLVALALIIDAHRHAAGRWRATLATAWLWGGLVLLIAGPALYVLASLGVDLPPGGDPLQIFTRDYSKEWPTGPLYWMTARWCEQATPAILAAGLLGLGLLIRSSWRRRPLFDVADGATGVWLIPAWSVTYLALHSILYNRGLFTHGGEARYMVPLAGLLAVQAAVGLRAVLIDRRGAAVLALAILLVGLIWLPVACFSHWLGGLRAATGIGIATGSILILLLGVLAFTKRAPSRLAAAALVLIAALLTLGQFKFYCKPLSLNDPVDPIDRPLGQAARYITDNDLAGRVLIAKHPLIRLLLPDSHLQWTNREAFDLWLASPPGTVFFYDSKNCNWPDPSEQETNQLLRSTVESGSNELRRFTFTDPYSDKEYEVILFEKRTPAIP